MILIITTKYDISSSDVIKWINFYNEKVIRINVDDNIHKFYIIDERGIFFKNTKTNEIINLSKVKSIWWRRNGLDLQSLIEKEKRITIKKEGFDLSTLINDSKNLLVDEANDLIEYIYTTIDYNSNINLGKPKFNLNKLIILDIAKRKGLKVPKYQIIKDNQQLKKAKDKYSSLVSKAIANGIYNIIGNHRFYSYTELIDDTTFSNKKVNFFPSLVMQLIKKKIEIRSFYIDGSFFSMAIYSQDTKQTEIDFRKYNDTKPNKLEPYNLPKEIELKLHSVFNEINLNTGSIDLIVDTNDEYFFLEINPVGQYGMVSEPCNYNLDKIIAKYLINGKIE